MAKIVFKEAEFDIEINGNTYIMDKKPQFPFDLSIVKIIDDNGNETEYKDAEIVDIIPQDSRYWFGINRIPAHQKMQGLIDYLAMMVNVELPIEGV